MKILVLGGDGFCGWPSALHLSKAGHDVTIVDNLSRRRIDEELDSYSLTPIAPVHERLATWNRVSGKKIEFVYLDVAHEYDRLVQLISHARPDAIVHFAEQRAAPYSMKSPGHKRYTVDNNVNGTHNVLCAIAESGLDIHLVHLGTMGVYGYRGGGEIPEGYLQVKLPGPGGQWIDREILHPADPGSVYHMTKTLDQLLFHFYNKNDAIRITDLHQGIVWGTHTSLTSLDEKLVNRFDYDGEYGTVLNRFLIQAAIGHPLTVYGSGGQSRAFIHINDTVECIRIAAENPPPKGQRVRIFNQMTEVFRVQALAEMIAKLTGAQINHGANPRAELAENDLEVKSVGLKSLGLVPTTLKAGLLEEVTQVARKYKDRVDRRKIRSESYWNRDRQAAGAASPVSAAAPAVAKAGS
ncbi:MAG TPA: NAD-dependent epimerase/dehydratase family protein [Usitatibacter sp.]|nr:NAD-dependent epimerase/dehydratase family protein [Usitatibacter sp.]